MSIVVACLWCGTKNDIGRARMHSLAIYCRHCGHRADKSKARCDCRPCLGLPAAVAHEEPAQVNLFGGEESVRNEADKI